MKVQVIGSGSMRTKYNSACYLIDDNIMVDFPNGACKYLYRLDINPSIVDYILLTHFHGDHYFDVPFYILNKSKTEHKNVNIYCGKDGKKKIKKVGNLAFPHSFRNACNKLNLRIIHDDSFKINEYEIKKTLVNHGRMKKAFGYIFKTKDKIIGFTGDAALCQNIEVMASVCDFLFCDCTLLKGNDKHLGIDNLKYLASKYQSCTFITNHMDDNTRKKLKELSVKNIVVSEDKNIFNII